MLVYADVEDQEAAIPQAVRELMRSTKTRGMVTAGLSVHGRPLGFLTFSSSVPLNDFPPEHTRRIRTIADQVAIAVENRRLFEEAQRRAYREHLAREILGKIQAAPDVEAVLRTAVQELGRALGTPRSFVRLGISEQLIGKR